VVELRPRAVAAVRAVFRRIGLMVIKSTNCANGSMRQRRENHFAFGNAYVGSKLSASASG